MNKGNKFIKGLAVLLAVLLLAGCGATGQVSPEAEIAAETGADQLRLPKAGDPIAIIKTNLGEMHLRLLPEDAPKAVENFSTHAKNGYYDGLVFHRVINRFMIQGGDPTATGGGGESIWGTDFEDEFTMNAFNFHGALSMANAGPNTNSSQFFIVQAGVEDIGIGDGAQTEETLSAGGWPAEAAKAYGTVGGTPQLDHRHTVFGQVYQGLDVLDTIAAVSTDANDKPVEDVIIQTITIDVYK